MNLELPPAMITEYPSEALRIERASLHNTVVSRLRDMIIEGLIEVGTRIHEGQLCEQLGISRTPLREALKVLASEGLVELIPGRGAVVRKLTKKDARDMMNVLAHLEQMAGPLICELATEAQIQKVRHLHDAMLDFYAVRDRLQYFKLNQQIHSLLIDLAGNESLALVHEILQTRMKRIRYIGDKKEESWAEAVADHKEITEALEARDGQRLSTAMVDHLLGSWERIKDAI